MQAIRSTARPNLRRQANHDVLRWLIFCFPVGLILMWSDRCTWNRAIKSLVSLFLIALVLILVLPQTRAPQARSGGVQIVSNQGAVDVVGPTMRPDALKYDVYVPKYIPKNSIVVEPTPSPQPYYVYANNGGKYYHTQKCRFVKDTTPKVTIIAAVNANYKRCKECKPPKLDDVYKSSEE